MTMGDLGLAGRLGVVTGGGRGIGEALSTFLADAGASVIVADIDPETASRTAGAIEDRGGKAVAVRVDVGTSSGLDPLVEHIDDAGGSLDFLVNNAAIYAGLKYQPLEEIDEQEWDRVQQVNVAGVWNCTKRLLPALAASGHGRVVNIASAIAFRGTPRLLHYVTSKAAVLGMTKAMARELGGRNITVNAIAPGFTWTDASLEQVSDEGQLAEQVARRSLKRPQQPEDVAGAVAFFCSDLAAYITGQTLVVDGGSHML
jgi:NAD(P)-dependent dehydrogenase (short-subunit alcohol dehydrogenase family)